MDVGPSTDLEFTDWIKNKYLPTASQDEIDMVIGLYSADPTLGSPYDTGLSYALTPQAC